MTDSEKLDLLLSGIQELKQHVISIEKRLDKLEERMANLEERVSSLEDRMARLEDRVSNLEERMANVESTVATTKMILENEIRVNIQRVAEGHLDLSRNLHDAMTPSNEVEMLAIRVGMLESDVKDLKAKLA
ncbi:MAG: hemolysin XhlA family protein [Lachnoclostridium sp.]|nr:hemolysin XhlA family protein [Lachnospira sp.]MCM1247711.1 hemolysin XhlA family protein [Lachnoclostridium sp.]